MGFHYFGGNLSRSRRAQRLLGSAPLRGDVSEGDPDVGSVCLVSQQQQQAWRIQDVLRKLLGWAPTDGPGGLTMFTGEKGPFAGLAAKEGNEAGWLPYVQVDNVDAATNKAVKLGAELVRKKTQGPAGEFSVVRDPGGALLALWQKA